MTRSEYLQALREALSFLDAAAREAALNFYDEMIEDRMEEGMGEGEAVASMEAPETIAAQMRAEEGAAPEKPAAAQQADEGGSGWQRKTVSYPAEGIRAVVLNAADMSIHVHAAADNQATLTYYTSKADTYTASLADGVLTLDHISHDDRRIFRGRLDTLALLRGLLQGQPALAIDLALPGELLADLTAATTNSRIRVEQLRTLCQVRLTSTNGRLSLENVDCKALEGKTTNSKLSLQGVHCRQRLYMATTNSSASAEDVQAGEELTLKTTNAGISFRRLNAQGAARLETKNGTIFGDALHAGAVAELMTTNATLNAGGIDAPLVTLRTSNGGIHAALCGRRSEWQIETHTSGHVRSEAPLANPGGARRLTARTSNGNIDLQFAGE